MDEEVVLLEEQLAAAQGDLERLQEKLAEAEARAASRESESHELRRQVESFRAQAGERQAAVESLTGEVDSLKQALAQAGDRTREAAGRYRDALLQREPDLPADLVGGDTVEEVDEAVARARQTVAQVRQHIEQQAQSLRVPAGAPVRGEPDTSSLSASEKIRLGLEGNK